MTQELFSVEQVATKLGLHVRTVRNYVRDGRLKAVRIGKQYRVTAEDLEAFTGLPAAAEPARQAWHAELSSVVEFESIDRAAADRLAAYVVGSLQGRGAGDRPLRVETIYDQEQALMKIIVLGDLAAGADLLRLVAGLTEGL
jgi:excisionase family DNA binding protein